MFFDSDGKCLVAYVVGLVFPSFNKYYYHYDVYNDNFELKIFESVSFRFSSIY